MDAKRQRARIRDHGRARDLIQDRGCALSLFRRCGCVLRRSTAFGPLRRRQPLHPVMKQRFRWVAADMKLIHSSSSSSMPTPCRLTCAACEMRKLQAVCTHNRYRPTAP